MTPQDLLDRSPEAAVRTLALALLDEAAAEAAHLRSDSGAATLHDFRVALRRLRTLFRAYHGLFRDSLSKKHLRALRDLARSTNGGRDADVQLEWLQAQREQLDPGAREACSSLVEELESRRDAAYSAIRGDVLARFTKLETRLRGRLSRYSVPVNPDPVRATFAGAAGREVRRAGRELADALEAVRSPGHVEEAHRARIQGKRLRYLVEPLVETVLRQPAKGVVGSIKALQDVLGRLHDMHVLAAEIARALVEAAAERARRLHEALYATEAAPLPGDLAAGLLAIDGLVRDHVEQLYQELRGGWSGAQLAAFSGEVEALAEALGRHGGHGARPRDESRAR